jgi:hypothetical protein
VPSQARGLAMSISFFLNVALGAGLGPTAVALANTYLFPPTAGLGPETLGKGIVFTILAGYAIVVATICVSMRRTASTAT